MQKLIKFFIGSLIVTGLTSCGQQEQTQQISQLKLENKIDLKRIDEPVVIKRAKLKALTGSLPNGKVPVLSYQGKDIPSQVDDIDNDSLWDELAFVIDFEPEETKTINVRFVHPDSVPAYEIRTNVRFAKKLKQGGYEEIHNAFRIKGMDTKVTSEQFQMEGPAWESDKVAFRNYFDRRNAMDIFGKTTKNMVLDSVGIDENYHEMQNWGMDILKVGNSLGAGALAMFINDSLYRICMSCESSYKLISEGPVRSIFKLFYNDWQVADRNYDLVHTITIWAGSYAYDSEVTLKNAKGDEHLVMGIVNKQSDSVMITEHNEHFVSIITHDQQAIGGEYLGMSVMMEKEDFSGEGEFPKEGKEISETFYAKVKLDGKPVNYSFYAGWEKTNPDFKHAKSFKDLMQYESSRKKHPIEVSAVQ